MSDRIDEFYRTGGPAFPGHGYADGMTLLDYFAGQALAGLLANDSSDTATADAVSAYAVADAMLTERTKRQQKANASKGEQGHADA